MDWEAIAGMVISVVLFVTVGGVILLRPLSQRLGDLVEAMTEERKKSAGKLPEMLEEMRRRLEDQEERLMLMEERLGFAEELMRGSSLERGALGSGEGGARKEPGSREERTED